AEGTEVQRLAVGDDAVEVEDDRAKRHLRGRPCFASNLFARADWNLQTVLGRRIWTLVRGVVVAVRVVRAVEVELVDALRIPIEIEIPAGRVRFGSAGQIVEHH